MLSYLLRVRVKVGTWVRVVDVRVSVWVGDKGKQIDRLRGRQIGRQADGQGD